MPTPQAYDALWKEHQELRRAAFMLCQATDPDAVRTEDALSDLWDLVGDYEPTEVEQGLVPIPNEYAEA